MELYIMKIFKTKSTSVLYIFFALFFIVVVSHADTKKIDQNIAEQKINHSIEKKSQDKISKTYKTILSLESKHNVILEKIQNVKIYNRQLRELIISQKKEMIKMRKDIKDLGSTNKNIGPLMSEMIASLEQFVELDIPFLKDERATRIKNLKNIMKRSDVSSSEKYRRILEAYQVENTYGRSIETYQAEFTIDSQVKVVNFLRIGRIALFYQSIDTSLSGMWSVKKKRWAKLSSQFKNNIKNAISVARKQKTPGLLRLPIQTPL